MIEFVVFDLDGTLVNSLFDLADCLNEVLTKHGYPTHSLEEYKYFVGNGTVKLVERALPEDCRSEDIVASVHSEFSALYEKNCLNKTAPYDGIAALLKVLTERKIKIAVASNKTDEFTKKIVAVLFEGIAFDYVLGQTDFLPKKPEPHMVHYIMDKLDAVSENTIYVGDSDIDVKTGHNSGLKMCGCCWGFRSREELESAGADFIIEKPEALIGIIEQL